MTIVIFSPNGDVHLDKLRSKISERGETCLIVDGSRILTTRVNVSLKNGSIEGSIGNEKERVPFSDVISFLGNTINLRMNADEIHEKGKAIAEEEWNAFFESLFLVTSDKLWVNPLFSNIIANSKLYQMKLASDLGFLTPQTILSNELHKSIDFFKNEENHGIALKRISHNLRSLESLGKNKVLYTRRLSITDLRVASEDSFRICPVFLQDYYEKKSEIRSYIMGNKVLSAEILSQSDDKTKEDWRRYPTKVREGKNVIDYDRWKVRAIELPSKLNKLMVDLTKKCGMNYGSIDLIRTTDDQFIFLEINSSGAYSFIEEQTGLKITDAMVDLLLSPLNSAEN